MCVNVASPVGCGFFVCISDVTRVWLQLMEVGFFFIVKSM